MVDPQNPQSSPTQPGIPEEPPPQPALDTPVPEVSQVKAGVIPPAIPEPAAKPPAYGEVPVSAEPIDSAPSPAGELPEVTIPEVSLPPQETIVIPAPLGGSPVPNGGSDTQFIPQGLISATQESTVLPQIPSTGAQVPPSPVRPGGSFFKTLLLLVLFFLIIGGIGVGVWFGISYFNESKDVTITYWGLWENDAIIAPVIADFEAKNPKIKVSYRKENHRQYRERLQSAINRGEGPDVFRYHATWIPMFKNDVEPVPPEVMSVSAFSSQYYKVATQDLTAGSSLWGIPVMIEGLGLYINEDLFATAAVTPPTSYEELINIVPRLTVKNGENIITSAIALGTTNNVEHFSDIFALMVMQNGGKLTEPVGKEAEEALQFYRKFATPTDELYTWNETQDNSIIAFANGRVAMILAPSWRAFDIKTVNPNLRFRIEPVPQLPGNSVTWASYWVEGVSSKSKYKPQAFAFLKHLTQKESVITLYNEASKLRLFGEPYALVELGSTVSTDPFVNAYIVQAQNARSFPLASKTHDNGINDRMTKYVEDAINSTAEGVAPTQALDTMARGFRTVLNDYSLVSSAP